jgi:hypothetical protein
MSTLTSLPPNIPTPGQDEFSSTKVELLYLTTVSDNLLEKNRARSINDHHSLNVFLNAQRSPDILRTGAGKSGFVESYSRPPAKTMI